VGCAAQWVSHVQSTWPVLKLKVKSCKLISPSRMPFVMQILLGVEESVGVMVSHHFKFREKCK
jgi:hypothetical protein